MAAHHQWWQEPDQESVLHPLGRGLSCPTLCGSRADQRMTRDSSLLCAYRCRGDSAGGPVAINVCIVVQADYTWERPPRTMIKRSYGVTDCSTDWKGKGVEARDA